MTRSLYLFAAAAVALSGAAAIADTDPDNAIKFRKSVMDAIGGSAGAIAAVLKGEVEAPIAPLTTALASSTDPTLTIAAFRTNTTDEGFEKTTALPKVWTDWASFEKNLRDLNAATTAAAAKGDDVTADDMQAVFRACKNCHDNFREK